MCTVRLRRQRWRRNLVNVAGKNFECPFLVVRAVYCQSILPSTRTIILTDLYFRAPIATDMSLATVMRRPGPYKGLEVQGLEGLEVQGRNDSTSSAPLVDGDAPIGMTPSDVMQLQALRDAVSEVEEETELTPPLPNKSASSASGAAFVARRLHLGENHHRENEGDDDETATREITISVNTVEGQRLGIALEDRSGGDGCELHGAHLGSAIATVPEGSRLLSINGVNVKRATATHASGLLVKADGPCSLRFSLPVPAPPTRLAAARSRARTPLLSLFARNRQQGTSLLRGAD